MAELINLINSNLLEWRIATQCGILFVILIVLLALGAQLKESRLKSAPKPDQSTPQEPVEENPAKLTANRQSLIERIAQKQVRLRELQTRLRQIEGIARDSEDTLTALYRQISDLKGGIESDKSKLRLRGGRSPAGR